MTIDARPPVAIRITRPYASEDEYLEHEIDTLTRASITLVGAQPRAEGVVLRFELVLASGQVLLRGEGRVTGFKANALHGVGGLSLRFTRLDTRSKALIDKAAALRERRRPSLRAPGSDPPSPERMSVAPLQPTSTTPVPPLPASVPPLTATPTPRSFPPPLPPAETAGPRPSSSPPPARSSRPPGALVTPRPPSIPPPRAEPGAPPSLDGAPRLPSDRDALLERLRARAKVLDPTTVRRLLGSRSSS